MTSLFMGNGCSKSDQIFYKTFYSFSENNKLILEGKNGQKNLIAPVDSGKYLVGNI